MTSSNCTLSQFFNMVQTHPQKVAVVLDGQAWTYSELIDQIKRVVHHLYHLNVIRGQIIYQFVERSLEMVCGFFGIICAGGVYCALNPRGLPNHLALLLKQLQGQYVLLHGKTCGQLPAGVLQHVIRLDDILQPFFSFENPTDLTAFRGHSAVYIMYTSGTTGPPKATVHTHRSLSATVSAYVQWDMNVYTSRDHVLQVATCTWSLHMTEMLLPLVVGGTLVLLRPDGHLNMSYFSRTLLSRQITTLIIGPAIGRALVDYLEISQQLETLKSVRNLCIGGETMKIHQLALLMSFLSTFNQAKICLLYGMSECNGVIGCRLVDIHDPAVPIGYPFQSIRCLLIDEQGQTIDKISNPNKIGQIHIGGSTLFHGYLNDPERTNDIFTTIDNQIYIRTGDLARYNVRGELVYVQRIDFQIKIRGQRVETTEIENTIINWSTDKISNCLVTKASHNEDLLVAYIVSNDLQLETDNIRDYCNRHLPQYMVPSYYVVLDKFPLNSNLKVDRKQLPQPSLHNATSTQFTRSYSQPMLELEERVHHLWCSTLQLDSIPHHMNGFALGCSSLSLMQFFNYYQVHFTPDKQLNVQEFFSNPTIANHVQLLANSKSTAVIIWGPLCLRKARASYAQENVWLAERTRFIHQTRLSSAYNTSCLYRIRSGYLSINEFLRAVDLVVARHMVFHTRLTFNVEHGYLEQLVTDIEPYARRAYPTALTTGHTEKECKALGFQETVLSLDDAVFRCHFIRYGHTNQDILKENDFIIFTFHHGIFDETAAEIFLKELTLAYAGKLDLSKPVLQYIDYTTHERANMDMKEAKEFWRQALRNYPWDHQLDMPYDFGAPIDGHRSGRCWFINTSVSLDITEAIIGRAKELNVTLMQLILTCFYIFLAELSPQNQDTCVTIPVRNRYRPELDDIIGLFVNMLPCRMILDTSSNSTVTFVQFLHQVQANLINIIKYGDMPYLEILDLHRSPSVHLQCPFLHAYFALNTIMDDDEDVKQQLNLIAPSSNGSHCSLSAYYQINDPGDEKLYATSNMFDTDVTILVDVAKKEMTICWTYSTDLFTHATTDMLSKRFVQLLKDLFVTASLQQLNTTPLINLIPMAKQPIHLWTKKQHEQIDRTSQMLTPLEEHIQAVFSRVLGNKSIDVSRSFFEQGGTSMKAIQAMHLLQEHPLTATVDANLFFTTLSVARLAQEIEAIQS